jgi:hypothetical protein
MLSQDQQTFLVHEERSVERRVSFRFNSEERLDVGNPPR